MYSMLSGAGAGSRQVPGKRQVASEGGYLWGTAPDGRRFVEFQYLLRQTFLLILSAFRSTDILRSRYRLSEPAVWWPGTRLVLFPKPSFAIAGRSLPGPLEGRYTMSRMP